MSDGNRTKSDSQDFVTLRAKAAFLAEALWPERYRQNPTMPNSQRQRIERDASDTIRELIDEVDGLTSRLDAVLDYLREADRYYSEARETGVPSVVSLYGYVANALKAEALRE